MNPSFREPVCLDFTRCAGGVRARVVGDHDEVLDIRKYMTWLRIRGSSGIGKLVCCRNEHDLAGSPIGSYSACLDIAMLDRIRDVVESTAWTALPRPTRNHFAEARSTIRYRRGSVLIERCFWTSSGAFIEAIEPVLHCIRDCMRAVRLRPAGVLALSCRTELEYEGEAAVLCLLRFENVGTEPVIFVDPRVAASVDERPWLAVAVAPDDSMAWPDWMPLELPRLPAAEPEFVVLQPGATFELSVPWRARQPGPHLLMGHWADYRSREQPNAERLPFMPLSDDGVPAITGTNYAVLGATSSRPVRFEVPATHTIR